MVKTCSKCKVSRRMSGEFSKDASKADGLTRYMQNHAIEKTQG